MKLKKRNYIVFGRKTTEKELTRILTWAHKARLKWRSGELYISDFKNEVLMKNLPIVLYPKCGTWSNYPTFDSDEEISKKDFIRMCKEKITHDKRHT